MRFYCANGCLIICYSGWLIPLPLLLITWKLKPGYITQFWNTPYILSCGRSYFVFIKSHIFFPLGTQLDCIPQSPLQLAASMGWVLTKGRWSEGRYTTARPGSWNPAVCYQLCWFLVPPTCWIHEENPVEEDSLRDEEPLDGRSLNPWMTIWNRV